MPKDPVTDLSAQFFMIELKRFLNNEITEQQYVDKHDEKSKKITWPESVWLYHNDHQTFSKLLQKLSATNRRMALFQSMRFTQNELMNLLECGKSTITDLLHPTTRRINSEILAQFGIIHRVPFKWVRNDEVLFSWDTHNFDYLETIKSKNEFRKSEVERLKEKLIFTSERRIYGYIVNIPNDRLYLRIESRSNILILDLVNSDKTNNVNVLISMLNQTKYQWISILYPSVISGHYFYIFIGYLDESVKDYVLNEFPSLTSYSEIKFIK